MTSALGPARRWRRRAKGLEIPTSSNALSGAWIRQGSTWQATRWAAGRPTRASSEMLELPHSSGTWPATLSGLRQPPLRRPWATRICQSSSSATSSTRRLPTPGRSRCGRPLPRGPCSHGRASATPCPQMATRIITTPRPSKSARSTSAITCRTAPCLLMASLVTRRSLSRSASDCRAPWRGTEAGEPQLLVVVSWPSTGAQ
mmetsp:Transcript_37428/g.94082  ORF Transcript_37428/g.94082 Transcript_37428/m.94082 type:complete len:202 (+) Transcript_37428:1398-2003(+)